MEWTVSGYCKNADQSRLVMIEFEENKWLADCDYPACDFSAGCPVAAEIRKIQEENS